MTVKNFFREVFKVTLFDLLLLAGISGIKFLIIKTGFVVKMSGAFIFIFLGLLFVFVAAVGVNGIIENKWGSEKRWKELRSFSEFNKFIETFMVWGQIIPMFLGFVLLVYFIAPDSLSFFLVLAAALFVRNLLVYLFGKKSKLHEKAEVDMTNR